MNAFKHIDSDGDSFTVSRGGRGAIINARSHEGKQVVVELPSSDIIGVIAALTDIAVKAA